MLHSQPLTIPEASILFFSDHYKNLKCKITQKQTSLTLCSKLINNCLETTCNINRSLEQFIIELYQGTTLVAMFDFNYDDLEEAMALDNCQYQIGNKKRKYVKFKKENDCCALYFTIQVKDVLPEERQTHEEYIYEDYVRQVANKAYKKLETKALKRIQDLENIKFQNKRMSGPNQKITTQIQKCNQYSRFKKQRNLNDSSKLLTPKSNKSNKKEQKIPIFAQSCMFSISKDCFEEQSEHQKKKNQYKLKKLKERARQLFRREISQAQEKDIVIIPQVKMTRRNMGLLSEGIVFPCRIKSENTHNQDLLGVKMNGFIETLQINNEITNLKKNTFNTNLFEASGYCFKKSRRASTLQSPDQTAPKNKIVVKSKNPPVLKPPQKQSALKKHAQDINFNKTVVINSKAAIKYKQFR